MSMDIFEPPFDGGHMLEQMRGRRNRKRKRKSAISRANSSVRRHAMIAEAAYYRAEHRGFEPGHDLEDWLQAEAELERALRPRTDADRPVTPSTIPELLAARVRSTPRAEAYRQFDPARGG